MRSILKSFCQGVLQENLIIIFFHLDNASIETETSSKRGVILLGKKTNLFCHCPSFCCNCFPLFHDVFPHNEIIMNQKRQIRGRFMRSAVLVVEKDGQRWSPNLSEF